MLLYNSDRMGEIAAFEIDDFASTSTSSDIRFLAFYVSGFEIMIKDHLY